MTVPTREDKPMLKNLVHDQIKILLERMETHPEEFLTPKSLGEGKWDPFMPGSSIFKHFTKVEQYLIRRKYCKIRDKVYRQQAYDSILETLVFKEEPETKTKRYFSTSNQPVLGTPTYTTSATEHIKLHQEVLHQTAKKLYKTSS
jgi:hypothetical protein